MSTNLPYKLSIELSPKKEDNAVISSGVITKGRSKVGGKLQPISCFLRDNNIIIAGATGRMELDRLFIEYFWVHEKMRGKGLGSKILQAIEKEAQKHGCKDALIDTHFDRAAKLYLRLGYKLIGQIDNFIPGLIKRSFLKVF